MVNPKSEEPKELGPTHGLELTPTMAPAKERSRFWTYASRVEKRH